MATASSINAKAPAAPIAASRQSTPFGWPEFTDLGTVLALGDAYAGRSTIRSTVGPVATGAVGWSRITVTVGCMLRWIAA